MRTPPSRVPLTLTALTLGAGVVAGLLVAAGPAAATTPRVVLADTAPTWLGRGAGVATPAKAGSQTQSVRVYLRPRGGSAALAAAVVAVSTPGSASYGKYLSEPQYVATYGPTAAAAAQVSAYLKAQGLHVDGVEAHRRYVTASGARAQLDAAFGVTLRDYQHDGQTVIAPTVAASLPAGVAAAVLTITGLDTTVATMTSDHVDGGGSAAAAADATADAAAQRQADTGVARPATPPPNATAVGHPCSQFYGVLQAKYQADLTTPLPRYGNSVLSYASCGYSPPQLYGALANIVPTGVGDGQTVGIVDAYNSATVVADTNRLAADYGWSPLTSGQYSTWLPAHFGRQLACNASGWTTEQTLDVQAVHTMRPDAAIRYYAAADCGSGLGDALAAVVDENRADVVSNSWGGQESVTGINEMHADEQIFQQGALQGQTFLFSSGDNGDNVSATGTRQVDYPASDPYVTSVGGTSTGIIRSPLGNPTVGPETGWGTATARLSDDGKSWEPATFSYGAGGGRSTVFPAPSWQYPTVPEGQTTGRAVPDIASLADPTTGVLVGQTLNFGGDIHYGEMRIGGTSAASPLVTGNLLQAMSAAGTRLGLANPTLYRIASAAFVDILPGKVKGVVNASYDNNVNAGLGISYAVRTWGQDSSLPVTAGYDTVTGRGRPGYDFASDVAGLLAQ